MQQLYIYTTTVYIQQLYIYNNCTYAATENTASFRFKRLNYYVFI